MKYPFIIFLLNLLSKTWRIKATGYAGDFTEGIVVFWHGLMLPVWKYFGKYKPVAVVSLSKDGEILSKLLSNWGFSLIRGSSSRKGREVFDEIVNATSAKLILITPDGPRGPIYEMKAGAVVAASRSGVPLFLCGVDIKCKHVFKRSWDKFQLPLPFSRIDLKISEPLFIDNTLDKNIIDLKIKEIQTDLLYLNTQIS